MDIGKEIKRYTVTPREVPATQPAETPSKPAEREKKREPA